MTKNIWGYVIAAIFGALISGVGGGILVGNRLVAVEQGQRALEARMAGLESGRTTPMADSTRERFNANEAQIQNLWDELRAIRQRMDRQFGNGGTSTAPLAPKGG